MYEVKLKVGERDINYKIINELYMSGGRFWLNKQIARVSAVERSLRGPCDVTIQVEGDPEISSIPEQHYAKTMNELERDINDLSAYFQDTSFYEWEIEKRGAVKMNAFEKRVSEIAEMVIINRNRMGRLNSTGFVHVFEMPERTISKSDNVEYKQIITTFSCQGFHTVSLNGEQVFGSKNIGKRNLFLQGLQLGLKKGRERK